MTQNSSQSPAASKDKKLLKKGIIGFILTALCCFTPILVILFTSLGISAWVGWLDFILIPAMLISMCVIGFALYSRSLHANPENLNNDT